MSHYECSECGEFMGFCSCASKRVIERPPQSAPVLSDPERWRKGFEAKYFIPSHIKFDLDDCVYKTKCEGEPFDKLAIQTNNMYSIWVDACRFALKQNQITKGKSIWRSLLISVSVASR